jgi:hypothetical protein
MLRTCEGVYCPLPEVSDHPSGYAHSCEETEAGSPEQVDAISVDASVQPEKPPIGTEVVKSSLNTWFQPVRFPVGIGTPEGLLALTVVAVTPTVVNGSAPGSTGQGVGVVVVGVVVVGVVGVGVVRVGVVVVGVVVGVVVAGAVVVGVGVMVVVVVVGVTGVVVVTGWLGLVGRFLALDAAELSVAALATVAVLASLRSEIFFGFALSAEVLAFPWFDLTSVVRNAAV